MKAFNKRVEQMHEEAENSAAISQEIMAQVSSFRQQFSNLSQSAKASLDFIAYAKDKSFGLLTKLDHIVYKQNGYISIETPTDCPQRQAIMSITTTAAWANGITKAWGTKNSAIPTPTPN